MYTYWSTQTTTDTSSITLESLLATAAEMEPIRKAMTEGREQILTGLRDARDYYRNRPVPEETRRQLMALAARCHETMLPEGATIVADILFPFPPIKVD